MNKPSDKTQLVVVGAKVPAEVREAIQKKALAEDRSVSQVISRLLATHPMLKVGNGKPAKATMS